MDLEITMRFLSVLCFFALASSFGCSASDSTGAPRASAGAGGGGATGVGGSGTSGSSGAATAGTTSGGSVAGGGSGGGSNNGGSVSGGSGGSGGAIATGGAATGGSVGSGTIIVSDNFDAATASGPPDKAKWLAYGQFDPGPAPVVDTARFHSPPNSVRVGGSASTGNGVGSVLVPVMGFPVDGNAFYMRVWMNWEQATTAFSGHSGFIVASTGRDNSGTELRLGLSTKGGPPMVELNLQGATDGGEVSRYSSGFTSGGNQADFPGPGFTFDANRWYCVEALFKGTPSEFRLWIDGTDITAMHVTDFRGSLTSGTPRTAWAPIYKFLKIGSSDYDGLLKQIWYDDVVVSTGPIGCN